MARTELVNFLRSVDTFARLSPEKLGALANGASVHEYEPGQSLTEQGWERFVWVPIQGLLRLAYPMPAGDALTIFLAGRGELIGCLDGLCKVDHDLNAIAVVPSLVAALQRERVTHLIEREPEVAARVIHALSDRVWSCRELRVACALSAEQRLARALLLLSTRLGAHIDMTRKAIAEISGLARETAIRGLAPLEAQGIIRSARGRVEIIDRARLEKLAAVR